MQPEQWNITDNQRSYYPSKNQTKHGKKNQSYHFILYWLKSLIYTELIRYPFKYRTHSIHDTCMLLTHIQHFFSKYKTKNKIHVSGMLHNNMRFVWWKERKKKTAIDIN